MFWQIVTVVIAPSIFWAAYLYYKDRHQPEPLSRLGLAYCLGFGSAYLALGLYSLAEMLGLDGGTAIWETDRLNFFLYAIGVIGPVEELAKLVPFLLVCVRLRAFDEEIDGIVYASMVALGFASLENLRYAEIMHDAELYARAIASPVVHCIFSSIWGYAYARAFMRGRPRLPLTLLGIVASAFLHGLYDFLATDPVWTGAAAIVILILWIAGLLLIDRLQRKECRKANP